MTYSLQNRYLVNNGQQVMNASLSLFTEWPDVLCYSIIVQIGTRSLLHPGCLSLILNVIFLKTAWHYTKYFIFVAYAPNL